MQNVAVSRGWFDISGRLVVKLPYDPAVHPWEYLKKLKTDTQTNVRNRYLVAAPITIAKM